MNSIYARSIKHLSGNIFSKRTIIALAVLLGLIMSMTSGTGTTHAAAPFPFDGVQLSVAESTILDAGFEKCFQVTYAHGTEANDILGACTEEFLVFGASPSSDTTTLTLAAGVPRDIFENPTDSSTPSTLTRLYNGVHWYYIPGDAIGFSDGPNIRAFQCDTLGGVGKLCWHLVGFTGGYRAGNTLGLNRNTNWNKVVYQLTPGGGTLSGTKWDDQDGDGVRDAGELGISNVQICVHELDPPDNVGDKVSCTLTAFDGSYSFTGLEPGFYRVAEDPEAERVAASVQTFPLGGQGHFVTLETDQVLEGLDFGNTGLTPAEIHGTKFNDLDRDGVWDTGELPVAGVRICISPSGQCRDTDENGEYRFWVSAGTYTVSEFVPRASTPTTPINQTVIVGYGDIAPAINFGNTTPIPPPADVQVEGVSRSRNGLPAVYFGRETTYTKDVSGHCLVEGVHSRPVEIRLVIDFPQSDQTRSQMMTHTGSGNVWSATFDPFRPLHGLANLTFYVDCGADTPNFPEVLEDIAGEDEIQIGGSIFIDPSGTIVSDCTGQPLAGVTATLLVESPPGSGNFVPAEDGFVPEINPQETPADGAYGWMVVSGTYKVRAELEGYDTAESALVVIPPAVTDLNIGLTPEEGCGEDNVAPVIGSPSVDLATINENGSVTVSGSFADATLDTHTVSVAWGLGESSSQAVVTPVAGGGTYEATHQYLDDNPTGTPSDPYTITVTVTDDGNLWDSDTTGVTVDNVAPVTTSIVVDLPLVEVLNTINTTASYTDVGTLDSHTSNWDWGDSTTSPGTAVGGVATGSHAYADSGVYTVTLTLTDDDTGIDTESSQFVVVYDPSAGFVTGGGWIESPAGACALEFSCGTATGKATFGFVSKYNKGKTTPSGETEFEFNAGGIEFHSQNYEWLVIAGHQAKFKGVGTINDAGNYGFILSAIDEELTASVDVDQFRIKIWDKDNADTVVYDNEPGVDELEKAKTPISGGSIVIHTGKSNNGNQNSDKGNNGRGGS